MSERDSSPIADDLVQHGPCSDCGSSDACATYGDGHTHCYSCGAHHLPDRKEKVELSGPLIPWVPVDLPKRRISRDTCAKWAYGEGTFAGQKVQVATYFDRKTCSVPVAQKIRFANKEFLVRGSLKEAGLFGQHACRSGGKMIVVTEGEVDALSVAEVGRRKWPVVSIPNGAEGALKSLKANLEFLESFETVVLMFDMDEPGKKAAAECAAIFSPGKCRVASLPLKDASDMLQAGRVQELVDAQWSARAYRPDGILSGADIWARMTTIENAPRAPWPHSGLEEMTQGIRRPSVVLVCAGTGVGKTEFTREVAKHLLDHGETLGYIPLEETPERAALGLCGLALSRPLHLEDSPAKDPAVQKAFEAIAQRLHVYDGCGQYDTDNLIARIKYMAKGLGCTYIVLDHISIIVSGVNDGDERRIIDNLMTRLVATANECGIGLIVVSHLKRPEGTPHEEGGQASLAQLRGSHALGQLSYTVVGLERNQQSETESNLTTIRVLKCRLTGRTGVAGQMVYNPETGRLTEVQAFGFESATPAPAPAPQKTRKTRKSKVEAVPAEGIKPLESLEDF